MLLELYVTVFVTGICLFALSFVNGVKHPLFSLTAGFFFGLLTYSNFQIDVYDVLFNSSSGTPQVVKTTINEPLLAYLTAILAIVSFVQFFYLMWAKAGEVIEDASRSGTGRW